MNASSFCLSSWHPGLQVQDSGETQPLALLEVVHAQVLASSLELSNRNAAFWITWDPEDGVLHFVC